jgi:hypothetical protein
MLLPVLFNLDRIIGLDPVFHHLRFVAIFPFSKIFPFR